MLVSVIIPVFNVYPYIAEALDSVLSQTYSDLDILIIDDGSTDKSGEICDEYAKQDGRIRVIHQNNLGLSGARNRGLCEAKGDAVAFLDSDDAYHPDFIRIMVESMIREKTDLVMCKCTVHNTKGRMKTTGKEITNPAIKQGKYNRIEMLQSLVDGSVNPGVWNKLYNRSLWKDIRFPVGHVYEDVDTTYRVIWICKDAFVLDLPLYLHRIRSGSITNTISGKNISDRINAWNDFHLFIEENIPDIFTKEQLGRSRQLLMRQMIRDYALFEDEDINMQFSNELRKMILDIGNDVEVDDCGLPIKMCYMIINKYPQFIRKTYPLYHSIKKIRLIVV